MKTFAQVLAAALVVAAMQFLVFIVYPGLSGGTKSASLLDGIRPYGEVAASSTIDSHLAPAAIEPQVLMRRIISPDIEANVVFDPNEQTFAVAGRVDFSEEETFRVQSTVFQASNGGVAAGETQGFCAGEPQRWEVSATLKGDPQLQQGPVQVCALASSRDGRGVSDVFYWCRSVTVVTQ